MSISERIANEAAKLHDLAQFMDDAEGARTGRDSGTALILHDISKHLYELATEIGKNNPGIQQAVSKFIDAFPNAVYELVAENWTVC